MSIAPADLFLMRLNVLVNIGIKAADTLWWTTVSLFIIGAAVWLFALATQRAITTALWVWQWCKWIKPAQSIALFIIGLAMFAYFAGVYALAQRH